MWYSKVFALLHMGHLKIYFVRVMKIIYFQKS